MNNCLKTTLKQEVTDTTIPFLGELTINVINKDNASLPKHLIVNVTQPVEFRVIGDGLIGGVKKYTVTPQFDGSDVILPVSTGEYTIKITNKYFIKTLVLVHPMFKLNTKQLDNMISLESLNFDDSSTTGDLSDFTQLVALKTLSGIRASGLNGDISNLSSLMNIESIMLGDTGIHGSINLLANLPALNDLRVDYCENVTGNISEFNDIISRFTTLFIHGTSISGDISNLDTTVFSVPSQYSNFSWKNTRPASKYIMSLSSFNLGEDVDKMLIDQAECIKPTDVSSYIIDVYGTRTSSSDSAVSKLKSKGYTIKINGVII